MSPNMISSAHPFSSRMTVAQRKEANALRKTLKPLMEKKRRARINESIEKLKALIVPLISKDTSRYSKLEKADILEMTVSYFKDLPSSPVKARADSYRDGYDACLQRVSALLPRTSLDQETCARVHVFIQQSMRSVPACHKCSKHSPNTPSSTRHERLLSQKSSPNPQSINGSNPASIQGAPQAAMQNIWRPW